MQEIFLGEAIKRRRLELGLTQEQLCEGICEPITISRLENGKQTPSRNRINALLERLDMPADRYYALLNKKELDIEALQKHIAFLNMKFTQTCGKEKHQIREQALQAHKDLEQLAGPEDRICRQLILRSKIILGKENGPYSFAEQEAILLEAIRLTCPSFDPDDLGRSMYTTDEIKIINQLALVHVDSEEHMEAIVLLSQLFKYIRKNYQNIPPTRAHFCMIAFNYARELCIVGQYKKAVEVAEVGREVSLKYAHYLSLPGFLSVLAESYHFLGDDVQSREYYFQTYYLCKVIGDEHNAQNALADARKYLNLDLSH